MKVLNSDETRKVLLDMMGKFHEYCENNEVSYFLYGGTLLGAVRHKGFIPWDDDIDLIMPRPDYEKLKKLLAEKPMEGFALVDFEQNKDYYLPFMKLVNTNTEVIEKGNRDQKLGVFIDIFPMDSYSGSKMSQCISMFRARLNFYLLYLWLEDKKKATNFRGYVNEYLIKPIIKRMDGKIFSRNISNLTKKYHYNKSDNIAMFSHTLLARRMYNKSEFFPAKKLEFEGLMLNVPNEWHKCLSLQYGDYMKLPPVEQRVEKHSMIVKMK